MDLMNDQLSSTHRARASAADQPGVLAYSAILGRLEAGEVFCAGTWELKSIRAAAYDLRIADDFMIIAGGEGAEPLVFPVGTKRRETIVLRPGQLAYVSTAERLRMPWDLAGQIGVKSSLARRGLLILGGGFVDPGFGQGHEGERLHFMLMNIGGRDAHLEPGSEKVASIQLYPVSGDVPSEVRSRPVRGMQDAYETHFESAPGVRPGMDLALGFFTELSKLREEVKGVDVILQGLASRLADVQSGTLPLITFGVAILGVTFLGVVFSSLMDLAASDTLVARVRILSEAAGGGTGILGLSVLACSLAWFGGRVIGWIARLSVWQRR